MAQDALTDRRANAASPATGEGAGAALDRLIHAGLVEPFGGFSSLSLFEAWIDWSTHLAISPAKQTTILMNAWSDQLRLVRNAVPGVRSHDASAQSVPALPQDRRFADPSWRNWPYSFLVQAFLNTERWWDAATTDIHGVSRHHLDLVNFVGRQALDTLAPSNFLITNPQVLQRTLSEGGANLVRGLQNLISDLQRAASGRKSQQNASYIPGKSVAITEGAVIHRTELAEVIQYSPKTETVHREPVVLLPAWIMKYYIVDLSPGNSLVRHLVEAGFSVFVVSWKNPGPEDRNIGLDDYHLLGAKPALDAALAITGAPSAHLVGYCLSGTLAAITAAQMVRDHDQRLSTLTLLAAQLDFVEAGELRLFIDESQIAALEDMMWDRGVLGSRQMAGTFNLLRSNDLIWSRQVHHYLMGEPDRQSDLSAWSSDATRLPYKMHSEYLRELYLDNDLAEGRFKIAGHTISLPDIQVPLFAVGTERDYVAPWRSVFKVHSLTNSNVCFVLADGGHNQGIVAPPTATGRHYRIGCNASTDARPDPDELLAASRLETGSWWQAWFKWLAENSSGQVTPPQPGREDAGFPALSPAPGTYVLG